MEKKILIIAGEASGDLHGSSLISELSKIDKSIEIYGIGGDKMINEGMKIIYHINQMSFLGFIEIIKHLPFVRKVKNRLVDFVIKNNIKHVVLIDYPGFNLSMAKSFNKLGIKSIYYISPQIWAWGKRRIKKIQRFISRMIVFFPFEEKLYSANNIKSDFVGHPLVIRMENFEFLNREKVCEKFGLLPDKEILLLMPGSRHQEVDKILPEVLKAAKKLSVDFKLQIIIACSDNIDEAYFNKYRNEYDFKLVKGGTYDLLKNSKVAIVKSGTSTLEAGIIGTPFIVVYKTNIFTYLIGKALIKIKNISLANIVAEENIVRELIQHDVNPERIYYECSNLLLNERKYSKLKESLSKIKHKLNTKGNPSKKAAEIIFAELNA